MTSLATATEADLRALEAAGTKIIEHAIGLERGDGTGPLVVNLGEQGLAAAIGAIEATVGTIGPAPEPAITPYKRRLQSKLSVEERVATATELCEILAEHATVEEEKKRIAKEYADKLAGLDSTIIKLRTRFESGCDDRDVDVYDRRDICGKKIRTYRADNNELIDERDMRPHELQMELDEARKKAVEEGRPDAEIIQIEDQIKAAAEAREKQRAAEAVSDEQALAATPEEAEAMRAKRLEDEARDRAAAGEPPTALLSTDGMRKGRDRNPEPPLETVGAGMAALVDDLKPDRVTGDGTGTPARDIDDDIPFGEGDDADAIHASELRGEDPSIIGGSSDEPTQ